MKASRRLFAIVGAAVGGAFLITAGVAAWAQLPVTREHSVLMERKLTSTQNVLAGIARGDFGEVQKEAEMLTLLSHEAGWNVLQTPEYIRLSEVFRGTADQLSKAARDKNMDAVGLAYVSLSISCIDCHRHARAELERISRSRANERASSNQ